ncbi:MAG: hypothetical protein ACFFCW_19895 [Candidatus Hodarchaeota archaeon]
MENVLIDDELSNRSLSIIPLNILHPDERLYNLLLIQPGENVAVSSEFVRNENPQSTKWKYTYFLRLARSSDVDLALSPEYSCPWEVIEELIENEEIPNPGKIWVLGCESIKPDELDDLAQRCEGVVWIYERENRDQDRKFLDPVCYIFRAVDSDGNSRIVFVVQFKGQAMADPKYNLERDNLMTGTKRYILRNDEDSIHLTTLICSDALVFSTNGLPRPLHTPYIIPHLQLNLDPRNPPFKFYRQEAYIQNRDKQEFVCINWAKGFKLADQDPSPFGGSAFYMKSEKLTLNDDRINANHQKGLYYTKCPCLRSHTYFFNYAEHVFLLRTTKPSQALAPGVLQRRTGPEMLKIYGWDAGTNSWVENDISNDGFCELCLGLGNNFEPLADAEMSPLNKERLLTLSNGVVQGSSRKTWFIPNQLKFFEIGEDEVVRRMTFVQDPCEDAKNERFRYLGNYARLRNEILPDPTNFPECIRDLAGDWTIKYPCGDRGYEYNLCKTDGSGRATVAFLGNCSSTDPDRVFDRLASVLQDEQRRLVVWYEHAGNIHIKWQGRTPLIDEDLSESRTSVAKEV